MVEVEPEENVRATIQRLQKENETLKQELMNARHTPSVKIGLSLLLVGVLMLSGSFVMISNTLAFIGLGLFFWGWLFLFVRPIKFVKSSLLDSTIVSFYKTIDRVIEDLKYQGKGIYIPAYPEEVYLHEYLKALKPKYLEALKSRLHLQGLKDTVIFIAAENNVEIPATEELSEKRFLVKNPNGICIAPPGSGLANLFEDELTPPGSGLIKFLDLKADFSKIDLDSLSKSLSKVTTENLGLTAGFKMTIEDNFVHVKIRDSIYKDLYRKERGLKSVHVIGCPLTSAIACALAKATRKLVTIDKDEVSPDGQIIQVWYRFIEG